MTIKLVKKICGILLFTFFSNTCVFCGEVVVEGSTTLLPILQRAAEEYMDAEVVDDEKYEGYKKLLIDISVRGGGSGVGINSLLAGSCDIASLSRKIKDTELKAAASKNMKFQEYVIAMDGIIVIVNTKNPKFFFTKQEIKDIYTGKVTNWSQLGGKDGKIVVISRDSASGTFEYFTDVALDKSRVRKDALMQVSNQSILNIVSKTEGAIGYIGAGYVNKSIKAVAIDDVFPTKQNILESKYPYSRPLLLYTNNAAKDDAKKFIDFVLSKDGQKSVEAEGFISVK